MPRLLILAAVLILSTVSAAAESVSFKVVGFDCAECGPPIIKALRKVEGVKSAKVNAKAETVTVEVASGFDREKLRNAMTNLGFAAVFPGEKPREIERLPAEAIAALDIVTYKDGRRVDLKKVMAPGKVTVVDFYGEWCGPCHLLETRLQLLMQGKPNLALRRVDIGKWDNAAAKQATELRATALPYIRVYDARGRFVTAVTGGMWDEVLAAIEKAER